MGAIALRLDRTSSPAAWKVGLTMVVSLPSSEAIARRLRDAVPHRAAYRRLQVWQMLTLPLWYGSDVPMPVRLPRQDHPEATTAASSWFVRQLARLDRRFWVSWWISSALRGATLGGLIALGWLILAIVGVAPDPSFTGMIVCAAIGGIPGLVFGAINRPGIVRIAAMLDRTFDLDQRLVTALDAPGDPDSPITVMQRADAANALSLIARDVGILGLVPIRECVHALLIGTTIVTIWMFSFDTTIHDDVASIHIPGYYPAAERLADDQRPLPNQQQHSASQSTPVAGQQETSDQVDPLEPIQQALGENELTQPAASSLDEGDVSGAASDLDAAASDIANASQEERDAIADDLDAAANAIAPTDPELAERISNAADDIRKGGEEAEQGVQDLSDAIEDQQPAEAGSQEGSGDTSQGETAPVGEQQPGDQQQPANDGQSGEQGEAGQSDPGAGQDAAPGTSDEPAEGAQGSEQPGSSGEQGEGEAPEGGEPGESTGQGDAEGVPGEAGQPTDGADDNPVQSDAQSPSEGDNAGSGPPGDSSSDADPTAETAQSSDQPKPTVTAAPTVEAPPGESSDGSGSGGENVGGGGGTLRIGGASDETVQSGNDSSSSSQGDGGGGAPVGSGDASSEPVGPAGPDSNVVPEELEDVVSGYFGGDEP
jgi:hypothetical protein